MQQRSIATATPRSVHPLGPVDYGTPVAWWGWSWEPSVAMSITELVAAADLDARTAALAWLVLAGHGSVLVAAQQPHSGKTTTLTALLDLVPEDLTRVYLRGGAENFEFLDHLDDLDHPDGARRTSPQRTLLLANELSSHLPVYLWGQKAVRTFRALREGYALGATLHADSAAEAIAQLRDGLGADATDLARIDLLLVLRRRTLVSADRLRAAPAGPVTEALVLDTHDAATGGWTHDRIAEARLVAERHGWTAERAERAIAQRADRIGALTSRGVFGIEDVRAALAPLNDRNEGEHA